MYLAINILGIIVFLAIGFLFSKNKKAINWKAIAIMVVLNLVLAWFLTGSAAGRAGVKAAADGFAWIVDISSTGTIFAAALGMTKFQKMSQLIAISGIHSDLQ